MRAPIRPKVGMVFVLKPTSCVYSNDHDSVRHRISVVNDDISMHHVDGLTVT